MILASLFFAFLASALHVSSHGVPDPDPRHTEAGRKYLRAAVTQGATPLPAVVPGLLAVLL